MNVPRSILFLFAVVGHLASAVMRALKRFADKMDPTEKRELLFSQVRYHWHKSGFAVAAALVPVALSLVASSAHAATWNPETNRIMGYHTGLLGFAGVGAYMVGAQQKKYPFRFGTVKRRINIGNFQFTPGSQLPSVQIPQVGMLSRVLYDIEGSYTVANAPLVIANTDGFDSIIGRAQITLNNGSAQVVDVSGIGLNIVNQNINTALPIKKGTVGAGNLNGAGLPLAVGAGQAFSYKGFLTVNANQRKQFEMGLINLQAPELRATVNLAFNPISQIFTVPANVSTFVGSVNLSYEYYEIPDLTVYDMPPLTLVRTIEEAPQAITSTGLQLYQFPRLGTMIEYHGVVILNNLYSNVNAVVSEWALRYNKTDQQYDIYQNDQETYEAELYGIGVATTQAPTLSAATPVSRTNMNRSAVTQNFWAAGDVQINGGDFRDAIDTEENTTTESLTFITAGTSLNAGKDNLIHVRRVVQRILPVAA